MFILSAEVCQDYVLASVLTIVRRGLNIIQIIVPILLIIAGTIQFLKLTVNPDDDKKGKKGFFNSIMSAVIIFFLPFIIDLTMSIISEYGSVGIKSGNLTKKFDLSACWMEVATTQDEMDSARDNGSKSSTISKEEQAKNTILSSNSGDSTTGTTSNSTSSNTTTTPSTQSPSTSNAANTATGTAVVNYAKQFIGNPYVYGGDSLTTGTDCSGFIKLIYANFGIDLPRTSSALRSVGTDVGGIQNARAGDIICYDGHVALFEGDGNKIVHASTAATGIKESVDATYRNIITIRRVIN